MAFFTRTITCPACFEIFYLDQVHYRCLNPNCTGRQQDQVYAKAHGLNVAPIMGRAFQAGKSTVEKSYLSLVLSRFSLPVSRGAVSLNVRCDACGKESSKRLCPYCHFELSYDAGFIDDHVIAIIGGRNTGKGHYLATLVHRLENESGALFNFSLRMLGDETRRRFEEDYRTPLFRRRTLIQPTQSATVDRRVRLPMVFRLTLKHRQGKRLRAANLSFFDSAGEDMASLDTLSREARYICHAAGLIFLLDPLQIDAVRQRLPAGDLPPRDPQADPEYLVERLRELFERQSGLSPTRRVRTPLALVLSKMDQVWPLLEPASGLRNPGEHFGFFNRSEAQSVYTEVWGMLQNWLGYGFSNRLQMGFSNYHYFAVSSLGQPPGKDGKVEKISSIRVEDPLLWLLFQMGLIPGGKDRLL